MNMEIADIEKITAYKILLKNGLEFIKINDSWYFMVKSRKKDSNKLEQSYIEYVEKESNDGCF